jgi:hypothetical protein
MEMDPTIGDWGDDAVDVAVADSSFWKMKMFF